MGDCDAVDWDIDRRLMPGIVHGVVELARPGSISVWISRVEVYPNGVDVTLRAVGDFPWHELPQMAVARPAATVQYADGRRATAAAPMILPEGPQGGPLVLPGAAGVHGFSPEGAHGDWFFWPFPDDGDLELTFDYAPLGVDAETVVLDGDALRAAATRIVIPFAAGAPQATPVAEPVIDSLGEPGPPRARTSVPVPSSLAVELARSDDVALWAGPFFVHDGWADVEVRVLPRDTIPGFDVDDPDFMFEATRPEGRPRFAVVETGRRSVRSGPGSGMLGPTQYRTGLHIDPLPDSGTVTIATDWPLLGVPESHVTVDVAALRR